MHKDILLGKETEYKSEYDAGLIFPIPRSQSRAKLVMPKEKNKLGLPFFGRDVWTAFEVSWLNQKGKPQVAIAEFSVAADSSHIVESKSFKLYLNSFNNSRFDDESTVIETMKKDLSGGFGDEVDVTLYPVDDFPVTTQRIGECIDELDVDIDHYEPNADLLQVESDQTVSETLYSHLLKSNCPVTNQPDWATVVIRYSGPKLDQAALLKYIISYREHDDFHEHCVEQMFCDIARLGDYSELVVSARYTRRGGLDINPTRSLKSLESIELVGRTARQ